MANEGSYNESFTVVADPYDYIFGNQSVTLSPEQNTILHFVLNNFTNVPIGEYIFFAYWITGVPNEVSTLQVPWAPTTVNYIWIDYLSIQV